MDEQRPEMIEFTVAGAAQPAGSKKAFTHPKTGRPIIVDANSKAKGWKSQVAQVGLTHKPMGELLDGALGLELIFYRKRPAGHFGANGRLRPGAPAFPVTRPDSTKLTRGTEDALTGILWRDDAQIVEQRIVKLYGEPERVVVRVWKLPVQVVGDLTVQELPAVQPEPEQLSLAA